MRPAAPGVVRVQYLAVPHQPARLVNRHPQVRRLEVGLHAEGLEECAAVPGHNDVRPAGPRSPRREPEHRPAVPHDVWLEVPDGCFGPEVDCLQVLVTDDPRDPHGGGSCSTELHGVSLTDPATVKKDAPNAQLGENFEFDLQYFNPMVFLEVALVV